MDRIAAAGIAVLTPDAGRNDLTFVGPLDALTASADRPTASFAAVQEMADLEEFGVAHDDLLVVQPEQARQLRTAYAPHLDAAFESAGFTEGMFANPRIFAGTAYALQASMVGTIGWESAGLVTESLTTATSAASGFGPTPSRPSPSTGRARRSGSTDSANKRAERITAQWQFALNETQESELLKLPVLSEADPGESDVELVIDASADAGAKVYSMTAHNDIVSVATDLTLGADPFTQEFGGTRLWSSAGPSMDPTGIIGDVAAYSMIIAGLPPVQIVTPEGVVPGS